MIEVEAKVKINNGNIKAIKSKISKISYFLKKEKKIDNYYTLSSLDKYPKKSLRIRKRSGFYEVNFKKSLSYKKNVHAKKEVEFRVSDINHFLALISDFGFKKWLTKIKISYIYKIKPNLHIELNYLKNLGWFIEVEYLVSKKLQIPKARFQVSLVLKELGFIQKEIIEDGYTKLLWEKTHKK